MGTWDGAAGKKEGRTSTLSFAISLVYIKNQTDITIKFGSNGQQNRYCNPVSTISLIGVHGANGAIELPEIVVQQLNIVGAFEQPGMLAK